jgi:hypothetical protein
LNIARPQRIAGVGLLITLALALAVSGCSGTASAGGQQNAPAAPPAAPKVKLAEAPISLDPAFRPTDVTADKWFTEADEAEIKDVGLAALQIMIEDHPEYTVEGFTPTLETWNKEVAPKLQPLVMPSKWPEITEAWAKTPAGNVHLEGADAETFRGNVILTSKPEILDGKNYPGYDLTSTWQSDDGEVCSPSDKPFEYDVKGVRLYSMMEQDWATLYPMVGAQMDVTVHCKEGGKLVSRVDHNVGLKRSNGQFFVTGASLLKTGGGASVMEK